MDRNWLVSRTNPEFLRYLSSSASISHVLAQIFINRGVKDAGSIRSFLSPSLEDLHDPFLMPDMEKAVNRIRKAKENKETVLVHGDYDADGITSTALLVSVLRTAGMEVFYHIPNRISEGYGFGEYGIKRAEACKAGLVITADCGITSVDEVAAAASKGMDVIVTDHHVPPDELPDAVAVIDPHRNDSEYPFRFLAGVGVVFKLIQALAKGPGIGISQTPEELLDLVALGTVADSVPLTGENRILVSYGIDAINRPGCRAGIGALKRVAGIKGDATSGLLAYTLIPRINAAGRLDDAGSVVELFMTDDETIADSSASFLDEQNRKRQKIEGEVLKSALDMIDPDNPGSAIVLSSQDWHPGVIGIVASRLLDLFYRPVFLFSKKDAVLKGSARSIPSLHLYRAIAECSELLLGFGGHSQAAGLRLSAQNLKAFREKINRVVAESVKEDEMVPQLEIDAAVSFSEINFNLVKEMKMLEPFGESNREPLLGVKGARILNHRIVGNNHLKMQLKQGNVYMDTIGFNMGEHLEKLNGSCIDIAFVPSINEWNGTTTLQLNLKAVRPSGV